MTAIFPDGYEYGYSGFRGTSDAPLPAMRAAAMASRGGMPSAVRTNGQDPLMSHSGNVVPPHPEVVRHGQKKRTHPDRRFSLP
ncbi:hypothetical protein, partial [uncultured Desulfovibrio sp.]|uniref:hypothetical protein n=1 Tax=uncultured Desulfovibrio sp. TaxID=167968 RepID=UPI0026329E14